MVDEAGLEADLAKLETDVATMKTNVTTALDALKAEIAAMVANVTYVNKPTAIYLNPILADLIDREAKAASLTRNVLSSESSSDIIYMW
jgi:hypothetical protein